MSTPQFKVTVTHDGADTDYINDVFTSLQVKKRENNYDVATLFFSDANSRYYKDAFAKFDKIQIWMKNSPDQSWSTEPQFGGNIRQVIPTINSMGIQSQLLCKGYGVALEETHCNRDYGSESSNFTLDHLYEICRDLVDNFVNLSFGDDESETGWNIDKSSIANIASDVAIKYINNPYRTNLEVVDLVCELVTAIQASKKPPLAGPHWIVDTSQPQPKLIINAIDYQYNALWPYWWNNDNETDSTLTQGIDFMDFTVLDKAEEFSNNVILITDFRRPTFDYWAEHSPASDLWDSDVATVSADGTVKLVGDYSIKMYMSGAGVGTAWYPKNKDAVWDITKWGSPKTIPRLNFYFYKEPHVMGSYPSGTGLMLCKDATHYFQENKNWDESTEKWFSKSLPVGNHWMSDENSKEFDWLSFGDPAPTWSEINYIQFQVQTDAASSLYIDDLHFSGKIVRSAKHSGNIGDIGMEFQKVLISRNAMDDSCVADDDTGFAGRIAHAELLRRMVLPTTITFTVAGKPRMMAGQKCYVKACKKADGTTFGIDTVMRMLTVQHDLMANQGFTTTVTATTDLKNSNPISVPDQYAMWQENMFLNSAEAKNIRSGAEVDLLIPILEKDYAV